MQNEYLLLKIDFQSGNFVLNYFWKQKMYFLTLDKIFILEIFSFVQDKKYFVWAEGRGTRQFWFYLGQNGLDKSFVWAEVWGKTHIFYFFLVPLKKQGVQWHPCNPSCYSSVRLPLLCLLLTLASTTHLLVLAMMMMIHNVHHALSVSTCRTSVWSSTLDLYCHCQLTS